MAGGSVPGEIIVERDISSTDEERPPEQQTEKRPSEVKEPPVSMVPSGSIPTGFYSAASQAPRTRESAKLAPDLVLVVPIAKKFRKAWAPSSPTGTEEQQGREMYGEGPTAADGGRPKKNFLSRMNTRMEDLGANILKRTLNDVDEFDDDDDEVVSPPGSAGEVTGVLPETISGKYVGTGVDPRIRKILLDILVLPEDDFQAEAPMCWGLMRGKKVKKEDRRMAVRFALVNDLVNFLLSKGCHVEIFSSVDDDELILWLSLGDPCVRAQDNHTATHLLDLQRYLLRSKFEKDSLESMLGIVQDDPKPTFFSYSHTIAEAGRTNFFEDSTMFKEYCEGIAGVPGSILRTVDRVRLLRGVVEKFLDLDRSIGVLKTYYVAHRASKLEEFRSGQKVDAQRFKDGHGPWANLNPWLAIWSIWRGVDGQPIHEVKDYFGERMGFYFLWLSYTSESLLKVCLLFVPVSAFLFFASENEAYRETRTGKRNIAMAYFLSAFIITTWTTVYTKGWARCQSHYGTIWGVSKDDSTMKDEGLPGFRGKVVDDPVNKKLKIKVQPLASKILLYSAAAAVTGFFLAYTFGLILVILFCQVEYELPYMLVSLMMSAQVLSCTIIWDKLTPYVVQLMNPKTQKDMQNLSVMVRFPVSFAASYTNIFFKSLMDDWNDMCLESDCTKSLRWQLIGVVTPVIFVQFGLMVRPYLVYRGKVWHEAWQAKQAKKERGDDDDDDEWKLSFVELQSKRQAYNIRESMKDYNIMMVLLGYVMLFGAIAPVQIMIVLVGFSVKIRIDAFKLCNVYQRVTPSMSSTGGIGTWNEVLSILAMIGRAVTLAIPLFNIGYLSAPVCEDIGGVFDSQDQGCGAYTLDRCNIYNDADFTSADMCCICGGGIEDSLLEFVYGTDPKATLPIKLLMWFIMKEVFDRFAQLIDEGVSSTSGATKLIHDQRRHVVEKFQDVIWKKSTEEQKSLSEGFEGVGRDSWYRFSLDVDKVQHLDEHSSLWGQVDNEDFGRPWDKKTYFGSGEPR